jgi:hypothetical protein
MSGKYDQIKTMSIEELKDEYYNCKNGDVVKKQMLKKIIKSKIKLDNTSNSKSSPNKKKQIDNITTDDLVISEPSLDDTTTKCIEKLISLKINEGVHKQQKKLQELKPIIEKRGNMEQYWESNQEIDKIDPRFMKEISTDHSNNKLMERLNCELDFRLYGEQSKDDIIKPYSNSDGGNYTDLVKQNVPPTFDPIREKFKKQKN